MPTPTSRQRILSYLMKERAASTGQVGRALSMSAAAVRHHLSILSKDGRIVESGAKQMGRGRPVKIYSLSRKMLGDNLAALSDAMLDQWLGGLPEKRKEHALRELAQRLAGQIGQNDKEARITKRLAAVIERLNEFHYQAHWEAGADGPRILFAQCPYSAIIGKHPELCLMDSLMLSTSMKIPARQISKMDSDKTRLCVFGMDQLHKA